MPATRKLIKWGSSETLIISLPRKWIKQNNLTADQIVKIQTNPDGTLTIIPQELRFDEVNIDITIKIHDVNDLDDIGLRIVTMYLDGWDVIKLESAKKDEFPSNIRIKIEEIIKPLMGLEILGINPHTILIKNVMSVESSSVNNLIRMISDQTIDLGKILVDQLDNDQTSEDSIGDIEWRNVKKYHYRIIREQRKALLHPITLAKMNLTLQDTLDFSYYITSLYKIAESFKFIIDTITKYGIPKDEFGVKHFFDMINGIVRDSIDSFLFKNSAKAIDILKTIKNESPRKRDIENKVDKREALNGAGPPQFVTFQVILDLSERIMDYCENVCQSALRRSV